MNLPHRIYTLSAVWLCMLVTAASAFEKSGEALKSARQKLQQKDYTGALADAEAAGTLAGTARDTITVALLKGQIAERQEQWAAARVEYLRCLSFDKIQDTQKYAALSAIAGTWRRENNLPEMKRAVDAALAVRNTAPSNCLLLRDYALLAGALNESQQAQTAWRQIVNSPGAPVNIYSEAVFALLSQFATQGQLEAAREWIDTLGEAAPLSPEDRVTVRLIRAGLNAAGQESLAAGEGIKTVDALSAEQKLKVYGAAAKFFMKAGQYSVVNEFIDLKEAMYREEPRKVYPCQFMDKAPSSVEGWLASPMVKDRRNRESRFEPYDRKAAELLIVDVRSERAVGDAQLAADKETGFYMACDDRGWHLFVKSEDAEVEKVAAGLLGGGQLELFFATAYGQRYYQALIDLQTGKYDPIDWGSPARGFRLTGGYYKSETLMLDKAIGTYIFYPWEMLYDRLPQTGDEWPFGVIRWTRAGGITTGGKVHEIHKWGRVHWNGLTPERRLAIQRKLVMKALGNYRKIRGDVINFWKDDELGDPEFFQSTLLPVIEKLDALGQTVLSPMHPAEIQALFETAVPDWFEFTYKVAELRSGYLAARLFHESSVSP